MGGCPRDRCQHPDDCRQGDPHGRPPAALPLAPRSRSLRPTLVARSSKCAPTASRKWRLAPSPPTSRLPSPLASVSWLKDRLTSSSRFPSRLRSLEELPSLLAAVVSRACPLTSLPRTPAVLVTRWSAPIS